MNIGESMILSQREEDASGTAPLALTAEATVADAAAWGTVPLLKWQNRQCVQLSINPSSLLVLMSRKLQQ